MLELNAYFRLHQTVERIRKEAIAEYWEKENREPQIVSQGKFYAFCESKGIKFDE